VTRWVTTGGYWVPVTVLGPFPDETPRRTWRFPAEGEVWQERSGKSGKRRIWRGLPSDVPRRITIGKLDHWPNRHGWDRWMVFADCEGRSLMIGLDRLLRRFAKVKP